MHQTYAHISTYTYISYTHAHKHTCTHTHIHKYTYPHTYMHTCIRPSIHPHTYMYTYMHTYIHIHIHMHTQLHTHNKKSRIRALRFLKTPVTMPTLTSNPRLPAMPRVTSIRSGIIRVPASSSHTTLQSASCVWVERLKPESATVRKARSAPVRASLQPKL